MKVSIVILNYNGNQDTIDCIESLKQQTYRNFEIIVVDNGSKTSFSHPDVTLIRSEENLGFAEGNNVAIRAAMQAKCDAIWMLNNDTEVATDTLEQLVQFSQTHPRAIVGARLTQFDDRAKLDHVGGVWNRQKANFDLVGANASIESYEQPLSLDFVCGASLFAPTAIFESVGLLEPAFFLIWEESDFCMRAKKQGFEVLYCPHAIVYHKVSASFSGGKPHTHYFWWRNRLLWIERHLDRDEKKQADKIIKKELMKLTRHFLLRWIQKGKKDAKFRTYRAGLKGAFDYARRRFGPPPKWVVQK